MDNEEHFYHFSYSLHKLTISLMKNDHISQVVLYISLASLSRYPALGELLGVKSFWILTQIDATKIQA